jgi:hypothetical protein
MQLAAILAVLCNNFVASCLTNFSVLITMQIKKKDIVSFTPKNNHLYVNLTYIFLHFWM